MEADRNRSFQPASGQPETSSQPNQASILRLGQIALAIALILTVKLIKWAKRWND